MPGLGGDARAGHQAGLEEAAPDLLGLEVEGVAAPPPRPGARTSADLPLVIDGATAGGNGGRPPAAVPAWLPLDRAADVAPGTFRASSSAAPTCVVANVDGTLLAYRDRAPAA